MGRTKKVKLDKLAQDMIQCKKDGFGVHYGAWRAAQYEKNKGQIPEKPKGYKHTCVHCETEFYTRINRKQKFCCDSCREEYYRIKKREEYQATKVEKEIVPIDKVCPICGKDFKGKNHRYKYCSEFCARVAHARAIQANNQKRSANKHGEE
jgi:hypothetical protein